MSPNKLLITEGNDNFRVERLADITVNTCQVTHDIMRLRTHH